MFSTDEIEQTEELKRASLNMLENWRGSVPPRIAAIVSAYYAEKYIEGRIIDLVKQTIPVEIVVVCQENSQEYKIAERVKFNVDCLVHTVTTEDIPTVYRAWNLGIKGILSSTVEYITNANADDRLRERALQEMVRTLDGAPSFCLCYGNQDVVEEIDGKPVSKFEWGTGGMDTMGNLLKSCFIGPQPVWRRSLHTKHGYFDESYQVTGDYEFWLRLAAAGESFYHFGGTVGYYLRHRDSREHREPLRTVWETARARSKYRSEK